MATRLTEIFDVDICDLDEADEPEIDVRGQTVKAFYVKTDGPRYERMTDRNGAVRWYRLDY